MPLKDEPGWQPAPHAQPCLLAWSCLTRMTGLTLPTSLWKGREINLLGLSLLLPQVIYPVDPLPTWSLVLHFLIPTRKEGHSVTWH